MTEVSDAAGRRLEIEARQHRFTPSEMRARVGDVLMLVFTRTDDDSCLRRVALHVEGDRRIERDLPMHQPIVITIRLDRPGEVGITCAKGGHTAVIIVEQTHLNRPSTH